MRSRHSERFGSGRFFDTNADPAEQHDLATSDATDHRMAREKLQAVLDSLPPDAEPPFLLRSQSGFKLRTAARAKAGGR